MDDPIRAGLLEAREALDRLLEDRETLTRIRRAADFLIETFTQGRKVFSCGNGGSMCDAMHFAEELTGRFRKDRKAYPALAVSDPSHLTCAANDFGYEQVFSRYLEALGSAGDCLIALSTSGKSPNVLSALKTARSLGMKSVALTGRKGSEMESLSDLCICTPAGTYADRVQELHIKVLHLLIETVERHFHPEHYR
jgi:D-sedoheptulose 7-phosphate isomerase